jgi:hypothetical protein
MNAFSKRLLFIACIATISLASGVAVLIARTRELASYGVNSSRPRFSRRAPMMAQMQLFLHRAAAVRACGFRLLLPSFPICCRNGDLLSRLQ